MKKLLILMLVLGMASSANALIVTLDPSGSAVVPAGTITVNVVSDTADLGYEYAVKILDTTYASFSSVTATSDAGIDSFLTDYADALGAETYTYVITTLDKGVSGTVQPGVQWILDIAFTGAAPDQTATLALLDDTLTQIGSYEMVGIPEPMTIALLGLGSLFLLRRRK